jgi:hypothetical protein
MIHKSQGKSVGPNEVWKKIVVEFDAAQARNKMPELEQVAFSRATSLDCIAVLDESEITYDMIMRIGEGKSYKKRQELESRLWHLATMTQTPIMDKVAAYGTSNNNTFDDGYKALMQCIIIGFHPTHHVKLIIFNCTSFIYHLLILLIVTTTTTSTTTNYYYY